MKLLMQPLGLISAFLLLLTFEASAQCPVNAFASKYTVVCGDPVTLTAVADGCKPLNNDFETGDLGPDWQATTGAVVHDGTGQYACVGAAPVGTYSVWMGAQVNTPRQVQTNDYDLTQCSAVSGILSFQMKYGRQGNSGICEGIEKQNEGVALQYSTNGGTTWTLIQYWSPNGGNDPQMINWNQYVVNIPQAAMTASTRFRWFQEFSDGAGFDTWGLDNMQIILNGPGFTYDWGHDAQGPASTSATPTVNPFSDTTFTVVYTNGVQTCSSTVAIDIIVPSVNAFASEYLVCEGSEIDLVAESSLIPLVPEECGAATVDCDPLSTIATQVEMGGGTIQSQTGNSGIGYLGASNFDGAVRSQFLFRAADMLAAGLQAGKFTTMQFDVLSNEIGTKTYNDFEIIYMCTNLTTLPGQDYIDVSSGVQVFSPKNVQISSGWHNMFFDQAFVWDGQSNILINMCWRSNQSSDVITRHRAVGYAATKTDGTNQAGTNSFDCNENDAPFADTYNSLPNFIFGQCIPRPGQLLYSWTSNPPGFIDSVARTTANPSSNPTQYIVSVNEQGRLPQCAVTDTVEVQTYTPNVTVNPNPAAICPPATTSATLIATATTNSSFQAEKKFTNNTAVPVAESNSTPGICLQAGPTATSTIVVSGVTPATLAANPIAEVSLNMNCARASDYEIELVGPSGQRIMLVDRRGAGANFTNTRFRTGAPGIAGGAPPFNGVYSPEQPFANIGGNVNGTWTIEITDFCTPALGNSTGTLTSWSITFNTPNYIASYLWSPAAGLSTTTNDTTEASPSSSTVYTLVVEDGVGCSDTVQVPVNVSNAPTIPVNDTTICAGGTATLTAVPFDAGTGTYSWTPGGQTTQSISVSPTSTTGYTVDYSSGGCTGTGSGTVTVIGSPTLSIADQTICAGETATLNAIPSNNGGTFAWDHGPTTQQVNVSPTATQYYYVLYDINGCSVYDSVLVTVNDAGTVTVNDETICGGNSTTLIATTSSAGGTFSWAPGGATTQSITVSPNTTTTYTVTYDVGGCTTTAQGVVTVSSNSTVNSNDAAICGGGSATITAVGSPNGGTYLWTPTGQTTASITVTPATTTTYTVDYTVNGCTSSTTSTVTVAGAESVSVNDTVVCQGNSTQLTATPTQGGGTYLWTPGNFTTQTITVSPSITTTYQVTYSIGGCDFTDQGTVTVNAPASVVMADTNICNGSTITITPQVNPTGGTYTWSTGANTPSITVSPTVDETYGLTYSVNGCSIFEDINVNVEELPTATISGGGTICSNQSATLQVDFTGQGPWRFTYSNGTQNFTINNVTNSPYTFNTNVAGTYTLVSVRNATCQGTVSGSATVTTVTPITTANVVGTCDANNDYTVSFEINGGTPANYIVTGMNGGTISGTGPYIFTSNTISGATPNYNFTISDGGPCNDATVSGTQNCNGCNASANMSGGGDICPGDSTTITLTMVGTAPFDVVYNDGTNNQTLTNITSPYTFYTQTPGNYSLVSVTDATACNGSVSGGATVNQLSNPSVTVNDPTLCLGDSAVLTANPGQSGGSFSWSNGDNGQTISITPGSTGVSSMTVTYDLNGCTSSATSTITTNAAPNVSSNDTTICAGSNAFLYAEGSPNGGSFKWEPVNQNGQNITVNPSATANYTVTYTLNGCSDDDVSTVTVNPSPVVSVNDETVCDGTTVTLTASVGTTGGTYSWAPGGQTTQSITLTPGVGTYDNIMSYTLGGCTSVDTGTVYVTNNPTVTVMNDTACSGESVVLRAITNVPGGDFIWGPSSFPNADSIVVSPATTQNYTVTYDLGSCSDNTVAEVFVRPNPSVTVNDRTICAGETATLSASTSQPGGTFTWMPGGQTGSTITVSPASTTTYTVSYDLNGCTATDNATVNVNNSATVSLNDTNICVGESVTLDANPSLGGGNFSWAPGGQTTQTITVSPATTTTYTVTYSVNGCSSNGSAEVTVNPYPTVQVTDSVTICEGNSTTLFANPSISGGTFNWVNPPANGQTTSSITVSPTTYTEYVVEYTRNGCMATDMGRVYVTPAATVSVTNDTICEGDAATLVATTTGNPNNITWSPGGFTGSSITVSPSTTTDYVATITTNSCVNRDTGTVVVVASPTPTPSNNGPYCEGETIQLNVDATPFATYSWAGPGGFTSNQQNPSRNNAITAHAGEYQVLVEVAGCSGIGFTTVVVNERVDNTITQAGPFCADDAIVNLQTTGVGGTWSGSGISNSGNGTFDPSLANIGNNNITYTPAAGTCENPAQSTIVVNPLPIVEFDASSFLGCAPFATTFTDLTNPNAAQLLWEFGDNASSNQTGTATHTYNAPGVYDITLTATTAQGCVSTLTKPAYIEVVEQAIADFTADKENVSAEAATVIFTNNSSNANIFEWDFNGEDVSIDENPSHTFGTSGNQVNITLIASNEGGCADTAYLTLEVVEDLLFFVPNAFTPDGDKFNQTFSPVFTTGYDARTYNFQVYNRWGELIFESNDPEIGWDGSYQNKLAQQGTYIWKLSFKSSSSDLKISKSGTLQLLK